MEIYTTGFTQRTARDFFESLRSHRIERLIDVRVNNRSQLAGFAKSADLEYFLAELVGADYHHELLLAPTADLLKRYRSKEIGWSEYEDAFLTLMEERRVEEQVDRSIFDRRSVLLCSEATPERCHRRLVVEYLGRAWGDVTGVHI